MAASLMGLSVVGVRSSHTPREREDAINRFQSPHSSADVFVSSISVCGMGVNLHSQCSFGIIVQYPANLNKVVQTLGRLCRVGQTKPVTWRLVVPMDSLYGWQENRILVKYVRQLAAQVTLHPALTGRLKEIVLYELMREMFGMPWSRFA
jgi:hypothetical protein